MRPATRFSASRRSRSATCPRTRFWSPSPGIPPSTPRFSLGEATRSASCSSESPTQADPRSCCSTGDQALASRRCSERGSTPGSRPLAMPARYLRRDQQRGLLATLREGAHVARSGTGSGRRLATPPRRRSDNP